MRSFGRAAADGGGWGVRLFHVAWRGVAFGVRRGVAFGVRCGVAFGVRCGVMRSAFVVASCVWRGVCLLARLA